MIGLGRAKDMVMRGRRIGAEEALSLGLVTEVVPPDELDCVGRPPVDELSQRSPLALRMAKRVLNLSYEGPLACRPRGRGTRVRPPAQLVGLPRGRRGVRRETATDLHRRMTTSQRTGLTGDVEQLLEAVSAGRLDVSAALEQLAQLPFRDLGFARVDTHRELRQGAPEAVLAEGKTHEEVAADRHGRCSTAAPGASW